MSIWKNDIKYKHMFLFPIKNLACKGLTVTLNPDHATLHSQFYLCLQSTLPSHYSPKMKKEFVTKMSNVTKTKPKRTTMKQWCTLYVYVLINNHFLISGRRHITQSTLIISVIFSWYVLHSLPMSSRSYGLSLLSSTVNNYEILTILLGNRTFIVLRKNYIPVAWESSLRHTVFKATINTLLSRKIANIWFITLKHIDKYAFQ